ncbi:MAG: hypothetical protein OXB97_12605 [Rhodospirillales bacterium]|nr:hypothetical protein [Rhodospirillales bacterium]
MASWSAKVTPISPSSRSTRGRPGAGGYVSIERAKKDYGVVVREVDADLAEFEVDEAATEAERERIRAQRHGLLDVDAEAIAAKYRSKELDALDLIRQYGVIVDWGTGELLPNTTRQFRDMLRRRTAAHWEVPGQARNEQPTLRVA